MLCDKLTVMVNKRSLLLFGKTKKTKNKTKTPKQTKNYTTYWLHTPPSINTKVSKLERLALKYIDSSDKVIKNEATEKNKQKTFNLVQDLDSSEVLLSWEDSALYNDPCFLGDYLVSHHSHQNHYCY